MTVVAQQKETQILPKNAPLGAEVRGIDLSESLSPGIFARIEAAFHEFGVLVFPAQKLTEAQHVQFSKLFGKLEIHVLKQYLDNGFPEIHVISNMKVGDKPVGIADAGRIWHADYSYKDVPARASLLYGRRVPRDDQGNPLGDTLFVNTALAYRELPEDIRQALEGRKALHNYGKYYNKKRAEGSSRTALDEEQIKEVAAGVAQPIFRTHPYTKRKCIYVSEGLTTGGIVDMDPAESERMLRKVYAHLYQPKYIYRHKWSDGDLVLWDNCSTQHLATGDYTPEQPRLMHRTTVSGTGAAY